MLKLFFLRNAEISTERNLKSWKVLIGERAKNSHSICLCQVYLVGVDDNIGGRVDGEEQVVHLDQEHDPPGVF